MDITLTKPQSEFYSLGCKYPLFIGGYGSGKTYTLIINALRDMFLHPGARVAIYSDTYDQLKLNIIPRVEDILGEEGIVPAFNRSEMVMSVGPSQLIFRSIDNPKRIIGYEVLRSHVDELEAGTNKMKAEDIWRRIMARNRQVCGSIDNRVAVYTTPDQGYGFTHGRWGSTSVGEEYKYVKASSESNPHLPEGYIESMLEDYPEALAKAYLGGEWCNLTSGNVYSAFDREKCNSKRKILKGEPLFIGMDFNVNNMAAIAFAKDGNSLTAVDELIGYSDTPAMIIALKNKFVGHKLNIYPDPAGRATSSIGASMSDIVLLQQEFAVFAPKAHPRIRDRVVCVNVRFSDARLRVNISACPQLSECLEKQAYDPRTGSPDKSQGYDHANDALGYAITYLMPIKRVANRQKRFI